MSRKTNRKGRPSAARHSRASRESPAFRVSQRVPSAQRESSIPSTARLAGTAAPSSSPPPDLAREYAYVLKDLRRIGIVAASMFALLVILALLLT